MKLFVLFPFIFFISCSSQPKDFKMQWPTEDHTVSKTMTSTHDGIDIPVPSNTPVYAAHKGIVVGVSVSPTYGRYIILENGQWATLYAHLTRSLVQRSDSIESQKLIGYSGDSGEVTGPHLHFEVLRNKQPVDPFPLLND